MLQLYIYMVILENKFNISESHNLGENALENVTCEPTEHDKQCSGTIFALLFSNIIYIL